MIKYGLRDIKSQLMGLKMHFLWIGVGAFVAFASIILGSILVSIWIHRLGIIMGIAIMVYALVDKIAEEFL